MDEILTEAEKRKRYRDANKEKIRLYNEKYRSRESTKTLLKQHREANKEKMKEYNKQYYQNTKEIRKENYDIEYYRAYRNNNKEKLNQYRKDKRVEDVNYRISCHLRGRLYHALKAKNLRKTNRAHELVGCTLHELKLHLESQWLPGMSWENNTINGWHIDHIRPIDSFDLNDSQQQKECFHYSNLRPLWAAENLSRSKDGSDLTVP
ncbi:hypothetical protein UFOVP760_269 [uncultured Caudovirales phage]|uniref:Uncharacterized protein n=1 Tax=uncultured Caudovirales phage TaxID=2100421 RepID=A0A6J7X6W2_9CAUD|nr:hypothetical protein UFOVP760_269 [uncultured Caudovirales phage]